MKSFTGFVFAILLGLVTFIGCSPEKPVATTPPTGEVVAESTADAAEKVANEVTKEAVEESEDEFDFGGAFDEEKDDESDFVAPALNAPDHGKADSTMPADTDNSNDVEASEATDGSGTAIELGDDGGVMFTAPGEWQVVEGKKQFVDYEMAIPKVDGEDEEAANGRLTFSNVGGGVEANIDRWCGQFKQPDGGATKDVTKRTELDIEGNEVVIVDMAGTYVDSMGGGPFSGGKKVDREGYRMLASIIQAGSHGQYTVKFYGPEKTVTANEAAFKAMIKSLQVSD